MVPLGDKIERVRYCTTFASVIALIIAATAQSYFVLEIASLLIELLYSASTYFAIGSLIEHQKNGVRWSIMSGLLVGILLSRTLSGFIEILVGVLCFGLPQDYVSYYFYHQETISL
jgi:hypothetical protein